LHGKASKRLQIVGDKVIGHGAAMQPFAQLDDPDFSAGSLSIAARISG